MSRKPCTRCGGAQAVRPGGLCNRCYSEETRAVQTETPAVTMLPLSLLRLDGGTQCRDATSEETVTDYADTYADPSNTMPPVVAFHDGIDYWLADGFHRRLARTRAGFEDIAVIVKGGTKRDAVLYAQTEANRHHGLRLTFEERSRRAATLLADPEWCQWNDREIGRLAGVHRDTVAKLRAGMGAEAQPAKRLVNRSGTTYETAAPEPKAATPDLAHLAVQPDAQGGPVDMLGRPLAAPAVAVFEARARMEEAAKLGRQLSRLLSDICRAPGSDRLRQGLAFSVTGGRESFTSTTLKDLIARVEHARPHVGGCPACKATSEVDAKKLCRVCKGTGWLVREEWDHLPAEMRQEFAPVVVEPSPTEAEQREAVGVTES